MLMIISGFHLLLASASTPFFNYRTNGFVFFIPCCTIYWCFFLFGQCNTTQGTCVDRPWTSLFPSYHHRYEKNLNKKCYIQNHQEQKYFVRMKGCVEIFQCFPWMDFHEQCCVVKRLCMLMIMSGLHLLLTSASTLFFN